MKDREADRQFGQRVRALRLQKGLSIAEVAQFVGRTPDTVRRIERGIGTSMPVMAKLYVLLGPQVLHDDDNKKHPSVSTQV